MIHAVDLHLGEPMRGLAGGIPHIPGKIVYEQMRWLDENEDQLRKFVIREPKGYPPL